MALIAHQTRADILLRGYIGWNSRRALQVVNQVFPKGCDGSVLLNSTARNTAEKDGPPNLSLRGFQVVDAAKAAVEKECPGVVSCADILALVARDAVNMLEKRVFWQVPTGRRDGRVSLASETINGNLPPAGGDIALLKSTFLSKGLSAKDLVVLSVLVGAFVLETGGLAQAKKHIKSVIVASTCEGA